MMRILSTTIFFFGVLLLSAQTSKVTVTVSNPLDLHRPSETIELSLEVVYSISPEFRSSTFGIFDGKEQLVSQRVDNDGDGVDDIVLFQSSFSPKQSKVFHIRAAADRSFASPVDVQYVLPREDLAWENDRIAFRIYGNPIAGNVDNGIDVWTKRVRYPIVAKWYKESEGSLPGKDTYHQDRGEGADFFSVGRSLGAGSAGLMIEGKLRQGGLYTAHRVITNGPIRTSFDVYYTGWRIDSIPMLEKKRITLDAGEQLNRIDEQFISNRTIQSFTIAAGIVKRNGTTVSRNTEARWVSLWGQTTPDSTNGFLGTAVVFPNTSVPQSAEDSLHYLITAPFLKNSSVTYFSGAAWSRMGDIRSSEEWNRYLDEFLQRKDNPLAISLSPSKK